MRQHGLITCQYFWIKLKASSKTKVNCLMYCMHPFTKPLVEVFSKSLKIWKFVNCIVPIYKLNKMNFQHTQETPTNIIGVVLLAMSLFKCYILHCPFLPYLCICQGVVTSPHTGRYSNDASIGDVTSELTLEKKPRRWQWVGSLLAHRHLLHLKKKTKRQWWASRLIIIFYI